MVRSILHAVQVSIEPRERNEFVTGEVCQLLSPSQESMPLDLRIIKERYSFVPVIWNAANRGQKSSVPFLSCVL